MPKKKSLQKNMAAAKRILTLPQSVNLSSLQDFRQNNAPLFDWREMIGSEHYVQFYETDKFLIHTIKEYISTGDSAVVIATKKHRTSLQKELASFGLSLSPRPHSNFIALDAEETLAKFMVNGMPDPVLFHSTINNVLIHLSQFGPKIRAYGEMVAVLWASGQNEAAIELEKLWDELQSKNFFSLLCAYPINNFATSSNTEPFSSVCSHHSHVLPAESYAKLETTNERLRAIALLQQKARSLEAELIHRKQLENQKDEFMAIASHELKTPITSLKAYGQGVRKILERKGETEIAAHLSKMDAQVDKLSKLVSELLDVTKIKAGKIQFNEYRYDIGELVGDTIEQMQTISEGHRITATIEKNLTIVGDKDRVGQVLINLLSNAIKYSPKSKEVKVTCSIKQNMTLVSVKDFGIGLDNKTQEKIFERFYRVSGQETYPGLGLGLYISKEIIERQGGKIWVESTKGKGSTFFFTLPVAK